MYYYESVQDILWDATFEREENDEERDEKRDRRWLDEELAVYNKKEN